MAKFHSYFVLCPLIDQKSFLGVSEDKDPEYVIVTLGRNVVHKYRLSDQKQVCGWTSKDHISSPVIYDQDQEAYVGVFNKNTIKVWKEDSENLDKIKKFKFPLNILKLLTRKGQPPLIVFENGNCASLPYALENRKTYETKALIKDNETIVDMNTYTINKVGYICYITKDSKDRYEIIYSPLREELGDLEKSKVSKVKVSRQDNVYVVGHLIDLSSVFVLWSDSKLTKYDSTIKSWKIIGSVQWVSTASSVSIAWMGQHHLIFFGSNTDQDGAVIVAYNTTLGVGLCKYPMKMYSDGAKLYCFHDRIILEASNHIGMMPYVLETKRNLSTLLGSHEIVQDETTEIADWDTPTKPLFQIGIEIKDLIKYGLTERTMCSQVLMPLLEKRDFRKVHRVIKEFKDVPETVLCQVLNYTLKLIDTKSVNVGNLNEFAKWYSKCFTTQEERDILMLLNYVFEISFSDALLIPHLRESLSLNDTLFLMTYISFLLIDSETPITTEFESKLSDWCILLMDAFYQQFLMTKDEKVTNVLENTLKVIANLIHQLQSVDSLLPLLNKIVSNKIINEDQDDLLSYTIEMMQI